MCDTHNFFYTDNKSVFSSQSIFTASNESKSQAKPMDPTRTLFSSVGSPMLAVT